MPGKALKISSEPNIDMEEFLVSVPDDLGTASIISGKAITGAPSDTNNALVYDPNTDSIPWTPVLLGRYAPAPATLLNVARSGTASADSFIASSDSPDKAIDGNTGTQWTSGNGSSAQHWLQIDLPALYHLSRWVVDLPGGGYQSGDFKLQSWDETGATWLDIDHVTGNTATHVDRSVTLFTTTRVRVLLINNGISLPFGDTTSRILELSLYGYERLPEADAIRLNNIAIDPTAPTSTNNTFTFDPATGTLKWLPGSGGTGGGGTTIASGATLPVSPVEGDLFVLTSDTPYSLQLYTGGAWHLIGDGVGTGGGGGTGSGNIGASVRMTATKAVANSATTMLSYEAVDFDTGGLFNGAQPTRLTIPAGQGGKYLVIAQVYWTLNSNGQRTLHIVKNGSDTSPVGTSNYNPNFGRSSIHSVQAIVELVAGDYLEIQGYQDSGGALNIVATEAPRNFFQVMRLDGGGGGSNSSGASVRASKADDTVIPNDVWTAFDLPVQEWDEAGFHSPTVNNSRFTVPVGYAGKYLVTGSFRFEDFTATGRYAAIRKNGTIFEVRQNYDSTNGLAHYIVATIVDLAEGDYVELVARQNSGSDQSVHGTTAFGGPEGLSFAMARLGGGTTIGSGTAFPTSPAPVEGDLFVRTDLDPYGLHLYTGGDWHLIGDGGGSGGSGSAAFSGASYISTVTGSVTDTEFSIAWNNQLWDTDVYLDPADSTHFIIPASGKYRITGITNWGAGSVGYKYTILTKNGTQFYHVDSQSRDNGQVTQPYGGEFDFAAGDVITIDMYGIGTATYGDTRIEYGSQVQISRLDGGGGGSGSVVPLAHARYSLTPASSAAVPNALNYALPWDVTLEEENASFIDPSSDHKTIVIPEDGLYQIDYTVTFQSGGGINDSFRQVFLYKNGTTVVDIDIKPSPGGGSGVTLKGASAAYYVTGDTLQVIAFQNAGGPQSLETNYSAEPTLSIYRVPEGSSGGGTTIDSGTAFPTSPAPAEGDLFVRTDLDPYGLHLFQGGTWHLLGDGGGTGGGSGGGSALVAARYHVTPGSTLNIPDGGANLSFDVTEYETVSFRGSDHSQFVIPEAGVYLVTATLTWLNAPASQRQIQVVVNGVGATGNIQPPDSTISNSTNASDVLNLAAGDIVTVSTYQASGGSIGVQTGFNFEPTVSFAKLGGSGGSGSGEGASVALTGDVTITPGVSTPLPFDIETFDVGGFHESVTHPSRLTVPAGMGGLYTVTGGIEWTHDPTGIRLAILWVNGVETTLVVDAAATDDTHGPSQTLATQVQLAAGDYVELVAYTSGAGNVMHDHSFFSMLRHGGTAAPLIHARYSMTPNSTVTVPNATNTALAWDVTLEEENASFIDPSSDHKTLVIPEDGLYQVEYTVTFNRGGTANDSYRQVVLYKNGTTLIDIDIKPAPGGASSVTCKGASAAYYVAGDTLQVLAFQNGGGAGTLETDFSIEPSLSIYKVSAGGNAGGSGSLDPLTPDPTGAFDWGTVNEFGQVTAANDVGAVTDVTATGPLASTGGATPDLSWNPVAAVPFNSQQLQAAALENLTADPASPVSGRIYLNSTGSLVRVNTATGWHSLLDDTTPPVRLQGSYPGTGQTGHGRVTGTFGADTRINLGDVPVLERGAAFPTASLVDGQRFWNTTYRSWFVYVLADLKWRQESPGVFDGSFPTVSTADNTVAPKLQVTRRDLSNTIFWWDGAFWHYATNRLVLLPGIARIIDDTTSRAAGYVNAAIQVTGVNLTDPTKPLPGKIKAVITRVTLLASTVAGATPGSVACALDNPDLVINASALSGYVDIAGRIVTGEVITGVSSVGTIQIKINGTGCSRFVIDVIGYQLDLF